jgi:hypothetical protein
MSARLVDPAVKIGKQSARTKRQLPLVRTFAIVLNHFPLTDRSTITSSPTLLRLDEGALYTIWYRYTRMSHMFFSCHIYTGISPIHLDELQFSSTIECKSYYLIHQQN